jgi:AraC family transcriptional regulator, regulatory protein of adaptative response / DNA-3-methyladenine glycosylase II
VQLAAREPFAGHEVLRFLGAHFTPGVEEVVGGTYRCTTAEGILEVTPQPDGILVKGAAEAARQLFDLDADWAEIESVLATDTLLRPMLEACPGVRVPGSIDPFEAIVRTVLAQQVSTRGAITLSGRLVREFGEPLPAPKGELTHRFPTPTAVAQAGIDAIAVAVGLPSARARSIVAVAEAMNDGSLDVSTLSSLPGIGPWTESIVRARVLRDPDAFPASDLALRQRTGLDVRELTRRAEAWRPWRSYATFVIWSYDNVPH